MHIATMLRVLLLAAATGVTGAAQAAKPAQPTCITTEAEPNNTTTQANLKPCSGGAVSGAISASTDVDWYRLDLPNPGTVALNLSHAAGIDLDWSLSNAAGTELASGASLGNPESGAYNATTAGTYYVRVKSNAGAGSYSLSASLPGSAATACTFPKKVNLGKTGNPTPKATTTLGGAVLMGGGLDVDEAFQWMIARSGGGDFVILRSSGTNAYNDWIYAMGGINSVQTLLIANTTDANNACVVETIRNAAAVFLAGGDQANYINYFKGQGVGNALNYLINTKGAPVGGTSAGMAVMGQFYHPGGAADNTSVLANPTAVAVGNNFIANPVLANLVTDQHFTQRTRQPRLASFMASSIYHHGAGWASMKGVGADENTAVVVDTSGAGKVYGSGNAFFVRGTDSPEVLQPATPLTWYRGAQALRVYKVPGTAAGTNTFNVVNWTGTGGTTGYWSSNNGNWLMN